MLLWYLEEFSAMPKINEVLATEKERDEALRAEIKLILLSIVCTLVITFVIMFKTNSYLTTVATFAGLVLVISSVNLIFRKLEEIRELLEKSSQLKGN